jgi:hypothetical protein
MRSNGKCKTELDGRKCNSVHIRNKGACSSNPECSNALTHNNGKCNTSPVHSNNGCNREHIHNHSGCNISSNECNLVLIHNHSGCSRALANAVASHIKGNGEVLIADKDDITVSRK